MLSRFRPRGVGKRISSQDSDRVPSSKSPANGVAVAVALQAGVCSSVTELFRNRGDQQDPYQHILQSAPSGGALSSRPLGEDEPGYDTGPLGPAYLIDDCSWSAHEIPIPCDGKGIAAQRQ